MFTMVDTLVIFVGMVVISKYRYCDPIKTRRIERADQLFPLFIMDTMGSIPGIPGIFVAGIFSASLSTVSSGINSLTAVVLEDIIRPYVWKDLSNKATLRLLKCLSVLFGLLCIGAAMLSGFMGNIIQAAMFTFGLLGSPMFGTFMLSLFVPQATNKRWSKLTDSHYILDWISRKNHHAAKRQGAISGLFCGFAFNLWMGLGALIYSPDYPNLEKDYVDGCPEKYFNATGHAFNRTLNDAMIRSEIDRTEAIFPIYRISFMYYAMCGVFIVVGVWTAVSFILGVTDIDALNPNLFVPPVRKMLERKQKNFVLMEGVAMLNANPNH